MKSQSRSEKLTGSRSFGCTNCQRTFSSKRGIRLYTRSCGVMSQPVENNETVIIDTTPEMRPTFKWG